MKQFLFAIRFYCFVVLLLLVEIINRWKKRQYCVKVIFTFSFEMREKQSKCFHFFLLHRIVCKIQSTFFVVAKTIFFCRISVFINQLLFWAVNYRYEKNLFFPIFPLNFFVFISLQESSFDFLAKRTQHGMKRRKFAMLTEKKSKKLNNWPVMKNILK